MQHKSTLLTVDGLRFQTKTDTRMKGQEWKGRLIFIQVNVCDGALIIVQVITHLAQHTHTPWKENWALVPIL